MPKSRTELVKQPEDLTRELAALSTEQLREELAKGLRVTADNLLRLAMVVKALEDRGESIDALRIGILPYLRQIACGVLLPETVVRFAGNPQLIARAAKLPHDEQRRLASGEPIKVVMRLPGIGLKEVAKDPFTMTPHEMGQVFDGNRLRNEGEQRKLLERRSPVKRSEVNRDGLSGECTVPTDRDAMQEVFAFAGRSSVGDLAEKLAEVAMRHPDPKAVAAKLAQEVSEQCKRPKKLSFA